MVEELLSIGINQEVLKNDSRLRDMLLNLLSRGMVVAEGQALETLTALAQQRETAIPRAGMFDEVDQP